MSSSHGDYERARTQRLVITTAIWTFAVIGVIGLIAFSMYALPQWSAWKREIAARAELAAAEHEKRIMIETATAERDAASLQAEAIEIVGEAAKAYPEYRQQQFIAGFAEALQNGTIDQIIYVPTEANIPVMEAGKR